MSKKIILGAAGIGLVLALLLRPTRAAAEQPAVTPSKPGTAPPEPMAVGVPGTDPGIAALLTEMDSTFRALGVDTSVVTPYDVTLMRKTPSKSVAIPPREYWGRMAQTLREVVIPLIRKVDFDVGMGGYRPPDYNAAVGGEPKSRHQWFEAVDMRPKPMTAANGRELALQAAIIRKKLPSKYRMGFGVYGDPTPNTVHVDTGFRTRKWGTAAVWIEKASQVA